MVPWKPAGESASIRVVSCVKYAYRSSKIGLGWTLEVRGPCAWAECWDRRKRNGGIEQRELFQGLLLKDRNEGEVGQERFLGAFCFLVGGKSSIFYSVLSDPVGPGAVEEAGRGAGAVALARGEGQTQCTR